MLIKYGRIITMEKFDIRQCAYIGDAVFELFVREICIEKAKTQKTMHNFSIKYVNANFQAHLLNELQDFFSEKEKEIIRRGRNLKISISKKSNPQTHSLASAFEVIVGYFYLYDKDRLKDFFENVKKYLNN